MRAKGHVIHSLTIFALTTKILKITIHELGLSGKQEVLHESRRHHLSVLIERFHLAKIVVVKHPRNMMQSLGRKVRLCMSDKVYI